MGEVDDDGDTRRRRARRLRCRAAAVGATNPTTADATTARIAIATPNVVFMLVSYVPLDQRESRQHGVSGRIVDAVESAIGSGLLAIAGTACTVANTLGLVLPGKKNAP